MSAIGSFQYFLIHAWDWDLSKVIGCAGLSIVFSIWTKLRNHFCSFLFFSGVILLFLALASPLDALSDEYLFSAHMLQHILLLMIIPPLLILGLPETSIGELLEIHWIRRTESILSRPMLAWFLANLILWVWHIPVLYNCTVKNEAVHIIEHLTFLISATIFWWPVLAPTSDMRLSFGVGIAYLFLAALSNMALGILLTFASRPAYEVYFQPEDSWKILDIVRSKYHLSILADQQLGGALMWITGGLVFLGVILIQMFRWYGSETYRV